MAVDSFIGVAVDSFIGWILDREDHLAQCDVATDVATLQVPMRSPIFF